MMFSEKCFSWFVSTKLIKTILFINVLLSPDLFSVYHL